MGKQLRIHHLLCIPLFRGEGYSDLFSKNMTDEIAQLCETSEKKEKAVCASDRICAGCPNRKEDGSCGNSPGNQVAQKDARLAEIFHIIPEEAYSFRELLQKAEKYLTEEIFQTSCSNCEWYQKGLCSYKEWKQGLEQIKSRIREQES